MKRKLEILPLDEIDSAKKERQTVKNPKGYIVLVHGICHGAWCWENFIDFFAEQGYQCYAVSLSGHGNSEGKERLNTLNTFTLSDYVEDVKTVVDMCPKEPILVGHSMGGAVVQKYIGEYANTVAGAVLFAPATAPKMNRWKTIDSIRCNQDMRQATKVSFGKTTSQIVHDAAFFTSVKENGERIQRIKNTDPYVNLLQGESWKITLIDLFSNYTSNHDIDLPIFVIGSYADAYFPESSLTATADVYKRNGKTALVILQELCHDMMLDPDWEESAKRVLTFVEDPIKFVMDPRNHWPRK